MAKFTKTAIVVAALAAATYWLSGTDSRPQQTEATTKAVSQPASHAAAAPAQAKVLSPAKAPEPVPQPKLTDPSNQPQRQFMALVTETIGKALLTPQEAQQFAAIVNSAAFKREVAATLAEARHQRFDFDREQRRFELISSLDTVRKYGNEQTKAWYGDLLRDRIFAKDYLDKTDVKYRRSLAGDKVEYLRLLRQADPERYKHVQEAIHESGDKLLLYVLGKV